MSRRTQKDDAAAVNAWIKKSLQTTATKGPRKGRKLASVDLSHGLLVNHERAFAAWLKQRYPGMRLDQAREERLGRREGSTGEDRNLELAQEQEFLTQFVQADAKRRSAREAEAAMPPALRPPLGWNPRLSAAENMFNRRAWQARGGRVV